MIIKKLLPYMLFSCFCLLGCVDLLDHQEEENKTDCQELSQNERINNLELELASLKLEVEGTNSKYEALAYQIEKMLVSLLTLHDRQQFQLNEMQMELLAVHECAQVKDFVTLARELCAQNISQHYCRVVKKFEANCHKSNDGKNLSLPNRSNLNSEFWKSADRENE